MTQNRETGVGQEEQGVLELCISGYTREGVHARMQSNAGEDEPQKPASKARESLRVPEAREGVHADHDQGHTGSRRCGNRTTETRSSRTDQSGVPKGIEQADLQGQRRQAKTLDRNRGDSGTARRDLENPDQQAGC